MGPKNAVMYLTSTVFMTESLVSSEADFDTKFQKVTDSVDRRAALAKKANAKTTA